MRIHEHNLSVALFGTIAAISLALSAHASGAGRAEYTIAEIGLLPGQIQDPRPIKINDAGEVIGNVIDSIAGSHAFIYKQGVLQPLGNPDEVVYAWDINNAGEVLCDISKGGISHPSLVLANGDVVDLSQALGPSLYPVAMNDVGGVLATGPEGLVIYNSISGLTRRLPDPLTTNGTDINNRGDVIAYYSDAQVAQAGALFVGDAVLHFQLPGRREQTVPTIINNHGLVAGNVYDLDSLSRLPFLYQDGHFTRLGTLPGDAVAELLGMNDDGQVVGYSWLTVEGPMRAFMYRDHKMTDLNKLIPSDSGWNLDYAISINAKGQIIGGGTNPRGEGRGFVLTPVGKK